VRPRLFHRLSLAVLPESYDKVLRSYKACFLLLSFPRYENSGHFLLKSSRMDVFLGAFPMLLLRKCASLSITKLRRLIASSGLISNDLRPAYLSSESLAIIRRYLTCALVSPRLLPAPQQTRNTCSARQQAPRPKNVPCCHPRPDAFRRDP